MDAVKKSQTMFLYSHLVFTSERLRFLQFCKPIIYSPSDETSLCRLSSLYILITVLPADHSEHDLKYEI